MNNSEILSLLRNKTVLFVKLQSSYDSSKLIYPIQVFDDLESCEKFINRKTTGGKLVEDFTVDIPHYLTRENIETKYGKDDHHISGEFVVLHNGEYMDIRQSWDSDKYPTAIQQFHAAHPDYAKADVKFRELRRFMKDGVRTGDWFDTTVDRRLK